MSATRVEVAHRFGVPVAQGFAYITDPENWPAYWPGLVRIEPGSRWSRPGPRHGLRGVYDRVLVRRGVARALRKTIESLERELA